MPSLRSPPTTSHLNLPSTTPTPSPLLVSNVGLCDFNRTPPQYDTNQVPPTSPIICPVIHCLPVQSRQKRTIAEQYINYLVGHAIYLKPKADPIIRLREAITTGNWPKKDENLKQFHKVHLELAVVNAQTSS